MNPARRPVSPDSRARSPPGTPPDPKPPRIRKKGPPEKSIEKFWNKFNSRRPGKVLQVLPNNPFARTATSRVSKDAVQGEKASKKYEQVRDKCIRDVNRIVKECKRINQKYRDSDFDIEFDLKSGRRYYLDGLCENAGGIGPQGAKRIPDIFEKPQFFVDGASALDVRQGGGGDCWLMAALASLVGKESLIHRICVAREEKVGVYGFVFYHDGEWEQCIIDDKLYLISPDFNESLVSRFTQEEWQKNYQTGSRALYFASCSDENETWLPLLEKAYAKAHGDYLSIRGGWTGEAVEDLTGGVTSEIFTNDILDRDCLWHNELLKVNDEFLFSASTGHFSNWLMPDRPSSNQQQGIQDSHAYSVLDARDLDGFRLLKLRNPWGKVEWTGAWSDGSKEWTLEWMKKLDHKFGDDGVFWISYEDLLKKYSYFTRTRLFDETWHIVQKWTSFNVAWSTDYHTTKFVITVEAPETAVVIVLSQLDDRYFAGLCGEYVFRLHFRVQKQSEGGDDSEADDYIVHTHGNNFMDRSISTDTTLEKGTYDVLVKILSVRDPQAKPTDEIVKIMSARKQEKLIQIGRSYDLAHMKGRNTPAETENKREKTPPKPEIQAPDRAQLRKTTEEKMKKEWTKMKKAHARQNRAMDKQERVRALREMKRVKERERANGGWDGAPDAEPDADTNFVDAEQSLRDEQAALETAQENGNAVNNFKDGEEDLGPNGGIPTLSRRTSYFPPSSPVLSDAASFYSFEFDSDLDMHSEPEFEPGRNPNNFGMSPFRGPHPPPPPLKGPPGPSPAFNGPPGPPPFRDPPLHLPPFRGPPRPPGPWNFKNALNHLGDDDDENEGDNQDDRGNNNDGVDVLDPWNAVCVVGLRVYSKDTGLSLKVVHPSPAATSTPGSDGNGDGEDTPSGVDGAEAGVRDDTKGDKDISEKRETEEMTKGPPTGLKKGEDGEGKEEGSAELKDKEKDGVKDGENDGVKEEDNVRLGDKEKDEVKEAENTGVKEEEKAEVKGGNHAEVKEEEEDNGEVRKESDTASSKEVGKSAEAKILTLDGAGASASTTTTGEGKDGDDAKAAETIEEGEGVDLDLDQDLDRVEEKEKLGNVALEES